MTEYSSIITHWLEQPHKLDASERSGLTDMLARYPYFVPARYMEAAETYAARGFDAAMLDKTQLYTGNWLLFNDILLRSTDEKQQIMQPLRREAAAVPEEIPPVTAAPLDMPAIKEAITEDAVAEDPLVLQPVFADDYFVHQGISVSDEISDREVMEMAKGGSSAVADNEEEDEKSLLVMMDFEEWLSFLKKKNDQQKSEEEDKKMLKSLWQREKLAAAIGEEEDEIPEAVFEMAINSLAKEDTLVSESLAEIHIKQGNYGKAIEIYRKLSLQNPQKKVYFADKIDQLIKRKQS